MGRILGRAAVVGAVAEALERPGAVSVTVFGEAGVGKTRLLDELVSGALADDWSVERIFGSPAVREVPLGAAAHLLPAAPLADATAPFRLARAALLHRAGNRRLLLVVDDADQLDPSTVALVQQVVSHGDAVALVAARTDHAHTEELGAFWTGDGRSRFDLEPLDAASTIALAEQVLGGPVDDELAGALLAISRGFPMWVQVSLETARADGAIVRDADRRWHLTGDLSSGHLDELVRARLRPIPTMARDVLELLAAIEPLPMELADLAGGAELDLLRVHRLVEVRSGPRTDDLVTAHPLIREAVVRFTSRERHLAKLAAFVDALADAGRTDEVDPLRLGLWMLESGAPVDPAIVTAGATTALARGDYRLSEELARAALVADPGSTDARVVLGRALAFSGRGPEAEQILEGAEPHGAEQRASVARARAHVQAFGLGRPDAAAALLAREATELSDTDRWQLDTDRALYGAISGDFSATIDAAEALIANPSAPGSARLSAYINLTIARSMIGRVDGLDDAFVEASLLVRRHTDELPLASAQLVLNRAAALMAQGHLDESASQCMTALDGDVDPATDGMLRAWLGFAFGMQGRIDDAIAAQRQALQLLDVADPFRLKPQSVSLLLWHRAQTADPPPAGDGRLADALDAARDDVRLAVWPRRARTWLAARHGDLGAAAASAVEAGTEAIAGDHVAWGMFALHDAVRLGLWDLVLAPLESALRATEGARLLSVMVDHARALRYATRAFSPMSPSASPRAAAGCTPQRPAHRRQRQQASRARGCGLGAARHAARSGPGGARGRPRRHSPISPRTSPNASSTSLRTPSTAPRAG